MVADNISTQFHMVIKDVDQFINILDTGIKQSVDSKDYEEVSRLSKLVQQLHSFRDDVQGLQARWVHDLGEVVYNRNGRPNSDKETNKIDGNKIRPQSTDKTNSALQHTRATQSYNQSILTNLGFKKIGGSKIYRNDRSDTFIISPVISSGQQETYWFDIGEDHRNKIGSSTKAWVLLRIVPNWFVFFLVADIRKHMNVPSKGVWRFHCELNEEDRSIRVVLRSNRSFSFSPKLLDRTSADRAIALEVK